MLDTWDQSTQPFDQVARSLFHHRQKQDDHSTYRNLNLLDQHLLRAYPKCHYVLRHILLQEVSKYLMYWSAQNLRNVPIFSK